jgi:hypothetical protein
MTRSIIVTVLLLIAVASCGDNSTSEIQARVLPAVQHARAHLRWKRFRTVQNDFARALELPARDVCVESTGDQCAAGGVVTLTDWLRSQNVPEAGIDAECRRLQGGAATCVDGPYIPLDNPRGVHVTSLGGNNPFMGGVLDSLPEPIVITAITLERFALTACGERVARDVAGAPVVFKNVSLTSAAVTATSPGVEETIVDMYKRFLARLPTAEERTGALSVLDGPPITGAQFARLACFMVSTLPEFAFQ